MLLMDEPINPSKSAPNGIQSQVHDFRFKWHGYQGTEPQHYQAHFNEIFEIVGVEKPSDDLENQDFEFQKSAPTPGDRNGVADVFTARLDQLFDWMNEGNHIASPPIRRFNGGLFDGSKNELEIVTSIMPLVRQAEALD